MPAPRPPEERFYEHFLGEPNSGCWLWHGASLPTGYGQMHINGETVNAHRFSYELHNGPISRGAWVLHKCDTPACVNPNHLYLGTAKDNTADMLRRNRVKRTGKRYGSRHSLAKLTEENVRTILAMRGTQTAIGAKFGVTKHTVSLIQNGKTWRHVARAST